MQPLLECIPNVSEGRDLQKIEVIKQSIIADKNITLLHTDIGYDANRTVFTFVGSPIHIEETVKRLAKACVEELSLDAYHGTHPHVGVLDVCPFVPLFGLEVEKAKQIAQNVAKYIGEELKVPTFLYEQSATREKYKSLAQVRKGGLKGITTRVNTNTLGPDYGPKKIHPTAGATVIGARKLLVAFNINLTTKDKDIAAKIAKTVRSSNPKSTLQCVRAIGWWQKTFDCTQVSINLTDYTTTGLYEIYTKVAEVAKLYNTNVAGSEMIGLVPKEAIIDAGKKFNTASKNDDEAIINAIASLGLNSIKPFNPNEKILEFAIEKSY